MVGGNEQKTRVKWGARLSCFSDCLWGVQAAMQYVYFNLRRKGELS